jgi:hypothetical protein
MGLFSCEIDFSSFEAESFSFEMGSGYSFEMGSGYSFEMGSGYSFEMGLGTLSRWVLSMREVSSSCLFVEKRSYMKVWGQGL